MNIPKIEVFSSQSALYNEDYVKQYYPEFHELLINKYKFIPTKFTELIYLYFHEMDERPICPVCGNPLKFRCFSKGYRSFCSVKCQRNSTQTKEKIKQTCLEKYGEIHFSKSSKIREKVKQTCLKKYGVKNPFQSEEIKEKMKRIKKERYGDENYVNHTKMKKTKKERYGDENYVNREKAKQTCLKKYGVDHPWKSQEIRKKITEKEQEIQCKIYQTKKKNHTFKTSGIEQEFKRWLINNNIPFEYQYKSVNYPFNCDFYFPNKDLYLEIQGNWTHGKHPFNPDDPNDIKILNEWKDKNHKYHRIAIDVWTKSDPMKRETVRENKLNWIEVFTCDVNVLIEKVKRLII